MTISFEKKDLINLFILISLVIGIPVGIGLVRNQNIFFSKAAGEPIAFLAGDCVKTLTNGTKVLTCNNVDVEFTSTLGSAGGSGCNPQEKDDNVIKDPNSGWVKIEEKECKKGQQVVTYQCTYNNKKDKPKTKQKKIKQSCGMVSPTPPPPLTACDKDKFDPKKWNLIQSDCRVLFKCNAKKERKKYSQPFCAVQVLNTSATNQPCDPKNFNDQTWNLNKQTCKLTYSCQGKTKKVKTQGLEICSTLTAQQRAAANPAETISPDDGNGDDDGDDEEQSPPPSSTPSPTPISYLPAGGKNLLEVDSVSAATKCKKNEVLDEVTNECVPKNDTTPKPKKNKKNNTKTVEFKYADNLADLNSAEFLPYTSHPMVITDFSFKDAKVGTKTIFVVFKDEKGKTDQKQLSINMVGPDPKINTISCQRSITGSGVSFKATGLNFGSSGTIVTQGLGNTSAQINSWKGTEINGLFNLPGNSGQDGQRINLRLTRQDGLTADGKCEIGAQTQLALSARYFCGQPITQVQTEVELVVVPELLGGQGLKQSVTIDEDGFISGLTAKFEVGKNYLASLKAQKSLRRAFEFTAAEGTTQVDSEFILPVGDIYPARRGDGAIDNRDKLEMFHQFGQSSEETLRTADYNQDGKVNGVDWACMRPFMYTSDEPEPKGSISTPAPDVSPTPEPTATPEPTPTATPNPTATPS